MSTREKVNCDESVYSVYEESINVDQNCCRGEVTCHNGENKDRGLAEKFTDRAVEKWTEDPSVRVRNDRCNKCRTPAVMGEVLSRTSAIFDVPKHNNLSKSREENFAATPLQEKSAGPEKASETKSQNTAISEYKTVDDSGMISQESELSESITPDFEFIRNVPTQSELAHRLTPVSRAPTCGRTIVSVAITDASTDSQPTQILTGDCELPDFRQTFASMLPSNFSSSSSPLPSLAVRYHSSDTCEDVVYPETQCDKSNNAPSPSLTPHYPSSDSQRTVGENVSVTSEADLDLHMQYKNSKRASPPLFSTHEIFALSDTLNARRAVVELKTQYDNSNSNCSLSTVSTQDYRPSDNEETALNDASDARRAVFDLETQHYNSYSNRSLSMASTQGYQPSDNHETTLTDALDTRETVIDLETQWKTHRIGIGDLEVRHENLDIDGSPPLFSDTSDKRQEIIDVDTRYKNSIYDDFVLADSTACNLELSDLPRAMARRIEYENSNSSQVTSSAPTELESKNMQRVIHRQIAYGTSNRLHLTGSTVSITKFLENRCGVDNEDLPTQSLSPFRRDVNENLTAEKEQTPKRKREEEPESLWTNEDYSESGSPVLEIMSNNFTRLSKVAADSCAMTIGTNLLAPGLFGDTTQNPENVNLDHCYSERPRKSFTFRTFESEVPKRAAEDAQEESFGIRAIGEFSRRNISNLRHFEWRRVKNIGKRKIDFHESKENRPPKKRRLLNEGQSRSTVESKESADSETRRSDLNESSEKFLSNRCCEYDHIFRNFSSVDDLLYEQTLLRHWVEPDYEVIKRKIDVLVTRIEALGDDL